MKKSMKHELQKKEESSRKQPMQGGGFLSGTNPETMRFLRCPVNDGRGHRVYLLCPASALMSQQRRKLRLRLVGEHSNLGLWGWMWGLKGPPSSPSSSAEVPALRGALKPARKAESGEQKWRFFLGTDRPQAHLAKWHRLETGSE